MQISSALTLTYTVQALKSYICGLTTGECVWHVFYMIKFTLDVKLLVCVEPSLDKKLFTQLKKTGPQWLLNLDTVEMHSSLSP